jgi:hypothetical protein
MLPPGMGAGSVVIRHSSAFADSPFVTFASYDVPSNGVMLHFGSDGRQLVLPPEQAY